MHWGREIEEILGSVLLYKTSESEVWKRMTEVSFDEIPSRVFKFKRTPSCYPEGLAQVMDEISDLLIKKHHDYGIDNLKKFGEFGILVRCSDKVERLNNILQRSAAVDESNMDTWMDLAGYAIQALMMAKGYFELPEDDCQS